MEDGSQMNSVTECHADMLSELARELAPHTVVDPAGLIFTWSRALSLIQAGTPGVLVECGTWFGGCAFGMALAQKRAFGRVVRPVHMLDSYEGLPPATTRDGPAALHYQAHPEDPSFLENCRAPLERVLATREALGLTEAECVIVKGWFADTVPPLAPVLRRAGGIAILRVDCDWYDPVRLVLDQFMPLVPQTGIVILDDYYAWDGAARAAHDWLSANDAPYRIRQGGEGLPWSWFEKRPGRVINGPL